MREKARMSGAGTSKGTRGEGGIGSRNIKQKSRQAGAYSWGWVTPKFWGVGRRRELEQR